MLGVTDKVQNTEVFPNCAARKQQKMFVASKLIDVCFFTLVCCVCVIEKQCNLKHATDLKPKRQKMKKKAESDEKNKTSLQHR